ncbi:hypothetical protein HanRHA438_Chr07g0304411 [Helianthus annuus]|uniref:Uncharacterized protein n=1 Tax=Helianthus annuus TaxID=4232 RepID=A0A251RNI1_HELAN|nr:hypothetical protein HanXRQr2_Chr07g0294081 [Helianthus annuus]KAJ0550122.1 hypothetical protein HanHA300_Chr07g0241811 [Helianthus annuus]KAJ0556732.1 hypothetical protein HanIR_Chr07g0317191 [Helianthus annuus]KAJ0563075.1 hypothetical protein HanHA89_Chr07g0258991 [Helianthus annuus]KAJ0728446.1 hypothetical protein HanLR1_Chr07g0241701 [Helianthus annuus]
MITSPISPAIQLKTSACQRWIGTPLIINQAIRWFGIVWPSHKSTDVKHSLQPPNSSFTNIIRSVSLSKVIRIFMPPRYLNCVVTGFNPTDDGLAALNDLRSLALPTTPFPFHNLKALDTWAKASTFPFVVSDFSPIRIPM